MKDYTFFKGTLLRLDGVTFDPISQLFTIQLTQFKVFNYTRRTENQFNISKTFRWIRISRNTPHILKLESEGVSDDDICKEIANLWKNYFTYGQNQIQKEWISMTDESYGLDIEKLDEETVLKYFKISQEEFHNNMTLYSPY